MLPGLFQLEATPVELVGSLILPLRAFILLTFPTDGFLLGCITAAGVMKGVRRNFHSAEKRSEQVAVWRPVTVVMMTSLHVDE